MFWGERGVRRGPEGDEDGEGMRRRTCKAGEDGGGLRRTLSDAGPPAWWADESPPA